MEKFPATIRRGRRSNLCHPAAGHVQHGPCLPQLMQATIAEERIHNLVRRKMREVSQLAGVGGKPAQEMGCMSLLPETASEG